MAKRTGDSERDLPQKHGRFEDPSLFGDAFFFEAEAPVTDP